MRQITARSVKSQPEVSNYSQGNSAEPEPSNYSQRNPENAIIKDRNVCYFQVMTKFVYIQLHWGSWKRAGCNLTLLGSLREIIAVSHYIFYCLSLKCSTDNFAICSILLQWFFVPTTTDTSQMTDSQGDKSVNQ